MTASLKQLIHLERRQRRERSHVTELATARAEEITVTCSTGLVAMVMIFVMKAPSTL